MDTQQYWTFPILATLTTWLTDEQVVLVLVALGLVVLAGVLVGLRGKKRRGKMPRFSAEQAKIVEDAITEGIECAYLMGTMSSNRRKYWYRKIAKATGLSGLVPYTRIYKMLHPYKAALLKAAIQKRLADGIHRPVTLPPFEQKEITTTKSSNHTKLTTIFKLKKAA